MSDKIRGIFTPHMVPLDARGEINESELRRYIDWLIESGVHGLYPNGSTGEFTRFTAEERQRIVRIVCDQAGGRVPVLAGAAEANVKETLRACETYAEFGARAVAIVSPFYYRRVAWNYDDHRGLSAQRPGIRRNMVRRDWRHDGRRRS
ncbi:dihydrodipicolinate synthase family protein [Pirellulales bacterium]|nr:dihydrodipicolinate synthase family protein [Pirellulales bacterium]